MRISILLSLFISSVVLFGAESVQGQEQQMKNQITAEASRAFEKVEALIGEKGYSTRADAADLALYRMVQGLRGQKATFLWLTLRCMKEQATKNTSDV